MKILAFILILGLILSLNNFSYGEEVEREKKSSGASGALTGALMGGLLGGGVGAAIGSASGKAGQGAAIGAGIGAVGGTLIGADQAARKAKEEDTYVEPERPVKGKVKKRIIREFDEEGNVISEKEVRN